MTVQRYHVDGTGAAADYAAHLLASGGDAVVRRPGAPDPAPDLAWARSGAMALCGPAESAPRLAAGPLASCADGAARALAALAGREGLATLDGAALLGERAASMALRRQGRVSPGGSCRLLRCEDGWVALNLARPEDEDLLPAWLESERADEPAWTFAERRAARAATSDLAERARLMGLPAAAVVRPPAPTPDWCRGRALGPAAQPAPDRAPVVLDLSALWAGPLCAQLLGLAGARVIKVESVSRPDGARRGPARFYDLLNAGKQSVALDLFVPAGADALRRLIRSADIVIESARPRALAQLGIEAEAEVAGRAGLTWVSITGYGRRAPECGWVAFGDDAGAAAGLSVAAADGSPLVCGDAIADPLTGLHAAVAALASWRRGGSELLDLALRDVAAHAAAFDAPAGCSEVRRRDGARAGDRAEDWAVVSDGRLEVVSPPRARAAPARARPLGADTGAVLARC